jgi:hypothetical protein
MVKSLYTKLAIVLVWGVGYKFIDIEISEELY